MGYGIIGAAGKKMKLAELGVMNMSKLDDHHLKLKMIFEQTLGLIEQHKPDEIAIEAPFFGKNVQSMLKLGRAQGVAIAAGLFRNIPVTEYSPRKIKQSITGNGNASKEQVSGMICKLLSLSEKPKYLDSTDALAVAMCHYFQRGTTTNEKNYGGWKGFLKENPGRKK